MIKASIVALAGLLGLASAQDPPEGWLGYASGLPPKGVNRLTYAEAYWKNLGLPATAPNSAFYSPWWVDVLCERRGAMAARGNLREGFATRQPHSGLRIRP